MTAPAKTELFGLTAAETAAVIKPLGLEKYRGQQIVEWIYKHGVREFAAMTNLAKDQRAKLADNFTIMQLNEQAAQHAGDGKTSKFLLAFTDGMAVETVLLRQHYGNSVCISTQVGCAMGCSFCASTLGGLARNLTGGEILAQVLYIEQLLQPAGHKVDSIVLMGSGEPLANYDNVLRFIRLIHAPYCLNLSYRSITLSTAGIVPAIDKLAAEGIPITLSISLHAASNELRTRLMPVNKHYPLEQVLAAGSRYADITGRRVTYEYSLIAGINDQPEHARELAALLKGRQANVNLIPVNPVPERGFYRPSPADIGRFEQFLKNHQLNVTLRREMGTDIDAACGQLRHKILRKNG